MFEPPQSDPDRADDRDRRVAQLLVRLVGERHLRRDRHRVAGVDAHRVDVLDRADDDGVVRAVAHQLELELVPAEQRLLDQHLADRALGERALQQPLELLLGSRGAAAVPAERERGPQDDRRDSPSGTSPTDVTMIDSGTFSPAARTVSRKQLAVFRALDHVDRRADQLDAELFEDARLGELHARLSAVWPPIVGSSASGRSRSSTPATPSRSSGSR